ncbi:MAG: glycerol-3-phosphate 1-O-acyltransferase PlsY, partial [Clostridia bacterium]|nr:glycerol-3-phosphate 1-O-acyltransferase PlsY [Clostridia bacterium]
SINTAVVCSKVFYHDDIRLHGSGNAGLTNTLRTYGKKAALFTLAGDILKTVLSILVGGLCVGLQYKAGAFSLGLGGYLGAMFCILGHVCPVYYKFNGGKGVLCTATAVLVLSPLAFVVLFGVFALIVGITKYVSLGSIISALSYPLFFNGLYRITQMTEEGVLPMPLWCPMFTIFCAVFITWLHRENIKRLLKGEERKLSFKKKDVEVLPTDDKAS